MDKNFAFMALAKGKESTEAAEVKRYIGVASVGIMAVNPSKEELENIYNTSLNKEPEYYKEVEVGEDKHKVDSARLDFIVHAPTVSPTGKDINNGCDFISKVTFFLRDEYRFNRDKTKVQVIDKYGRTAWVTNEQYKNKEIPVYKNGPANLDKDYRACFAGEEELTQFLKCFLNIDNVEKWDNGKIVGLVDNPEECECRLDSIKEYFKGNIAEIRDNVKTMPNNMLKVLFGVKVTDDNKEYQDVFIQMFLKNGANKYDSLEKRVDQAKENGQYANTEFKIQEIAEYKVEATSFDTPINDEPINWDAV